MIPPRWRLPLAAAGSVLLHGSAVWLLMPHPAGRPGVEQPPLIEVELIDQSELVKGQAAAPAAQPPPEPDSPPRPQADAGPPPPPPPSQPAPPGPRAAPAAVNLGGAEEDREALSVTGPNVVPPRPDAAIRNRPPNYPSEAARRGHEGIVVIRARITETGTPAWVDVVVSSGDDSLDRSAREAVALWRFQPARNNGVAVPFDYDVNIRFSLGRDSAR